ncbi:MAG TPA: SRPBCC family protein [Myxococcota bacterium]|nr:SRPBCC family protein [Myxococcota bacterium]HND30649.1 SRPBCC family protein [Myxococcota bacterium]HNH45657.1 SRPBCC family protein [Myxococcota bacterium]
MAVDVLTEILIERPPDIVASFAGNPDHAAQWYENIKAVAWKSPPPMQVGSLVAFVAHFLGRKLEYTYEIREWLPGQKLVMATADGPFPMETTYTWTAEGSGTRMTLRNRGEPTGFSKLAAPLMTLAMRRANEGDLRKLKEILEGGG